MLDILNVFYKMARDNLQKADTVKHSERKA
jgi:hypothetical protein